LAALAPVKECALAVSQAKEDLSVLLDAVLATTL